ncbi:ATP-binding protein [Chitinophagaceae bacterium LB-8]|uniref:histidine kinase n=1 Tax=Paraflavisolibacter caeni TaxID=2982496 RepID=A0A9X2XVW0_9BACT|nr:sensor histidine kinase [Paraflavisolibacter caeni]MCU7549586.1 ATP-binding protein [Paraflavisolibacter caeni]
MKLQLLAGLLMFVITANTQPYYFRHYQVENGLSHNTIFCSVQDQKGFLWFGTKDGLNRFDGYRFKTFNIANEKSGGKGADLILSLATDRKGTVWVGTEKGLLYFDAAKERFHPFLDTIRGINDLFFDYAGQLWFIADNTVCRYNFTTKRLTLFPSERFFNATSLCETPDGTMWFSTADGELQQFNAATQTFKAYQVFRHSPAADSKVIQKIVYDQRGSILIGTSNQGIKEFKLNTLDYTDVLMYNADKTTIYVRDILQVNNEETWFATESGIYILNHATGKFLQLKKKHLDPYSLSDNAIYTLYKDIEGGIWAGTFFGGLNYFPKQHTTFQKYFPDYSKNSISGNAVREICEDDQGNIWIGTEDAGLNKLDPKTGMTTHFEPTGKPGSISYYNIHGLLAVKDEIWIGTFEHGLNILDIATGRVKKHYSAGAGAHRFQNNFIVTLLQTRNGAIFLGTALGVYQYNPKVDGFDYLNEIADGSFIACMQEDQQGTIWVATHNRGLYYFNPLTGIKGRFINEPGHDNSIPENSINSIFEDSERNLWLSTEGGGLCRLDPSRRKFTRYHTKDGLPSSFIFKVLEDDHKTLWITTAKGLVNMDRANGKMKVYTKSNGLINDQFNYNSGYKDKQGNLYFGSVQGMIQFNPSTFRQDKYIPAVNITGLQVENKEVDISKDSSILHQSILYTNKITLPYDQSSFSIDFAALRFTSPETTVYSYIMEGLDKEWTYLPSNRKVYFTNLKPGRYTFKVKAGNGEAWNEPKELAILITPPFWATTGAFLFYIVIVSSLVYYLIRTYHQIQENKKEKEIYQAKMEFFTNIAHEIKTPLTLIKGPVENLSDMAGHVPEIKEEVDTMERNTDRLINLINQILDFRQTETKGFSLDFSEVHINELVQEAHLTFQPLAKKRKLSYTLELPAADLHMKADAEALTKILNNLISNAVKYAQHEVSTKVIAPHKGANKLLIEISNDGYIIPAEMREKIFEPFFRIKETSKQKGTGLGLALVRSLVELHNGKVYLKEQGGHCNVFVVEIPAE